MGFIASAVSSVVSWVGDTISNVVDTVGGVISNALKNPLGTIAQIAAVATGNVWALPVIAGVQTAVNGGNILDVFKSVAISAIAQKAAPMIGEKVQGVLGESVNKTVANVIASGAASSAVAVITGKDPLQAFVAGGVGAAVPAVLGQLDAATGGNFKALPPTAQQVISSAVAAQLSGGNVTSAIINTALRTSQYVTQALNDLGVKGPNSTLSVQNQAILSDILYNTAAAAMSGTSASNVVQAALMKAGSKAIGDMASQQFDVLTGRVKEVYNSMTGQIDLITNNEASQKGIITNYNNLKTELDGRLSTLESLKTDAQTKIDKFNADRTSQANYDAANAAIAKYNDYAATLNTDYTNKYKPTFDNYQAQLDALQKTHTDLTSKYDNLNLQFSDATGNLDLAVDKTSKAVNETVATTMDPKFNAAEYAAINGLDSSVDPYNHWLTTGKNQGLYTNLAAASADIDAKQSGLIQSIAKSLGLEVNQISSKDFAALVKTIETKYGNNLSALNTAKASDIIGNLTKEQLFADSAKSGFKGDLNTTVYGDWNKPANLTLPAGVKLATKEEYIAGITKQGVDANGNIYSYVPDKSTAPNVWSNVDGVMSVKTDPVYITDSAATVNSVVERAFTLASFPDAANKVDQIAIDAAKNLVDKAKATGNVNNITATNMDAAIKAQTLKQDISTIFDFNKTNGISPEGPNTALFGGSLQSGGAGAPVTTLGPLSNKYSLLGYGGNFYVKDLTNDRVYTVLNVGTSTILRDAATNIEVTLTPDQAKALQGQLAGGLAGNLDTVPGATDIAKLAAGMSATNGKTVAENTTTINNQINAGTTTLAEAKAMLTAAGYTNPTDAEAQQFVSIRNSEATSKQNIEAWANPLVSTTAEVQQFFKDIGYTPTTAEVAKFVGKIAEAKNKTDIATYTDPLMVDAQEVTAAFKAMGIKYPDPSDVLKFVGQYNESLMQSKIDPNKQDIQFHSLQYQLDQLMSGNAGGGGASTTQLNSLEQKISDKMAANEAAGMSRDEAIKSAITQVATDLGTTKTNILTALNTSETTLSNKITTAVSGLEQKISDKMAAYEAAGLTRDQALQKAVDSVAADLNTTKSDLMAKIGATDSNLSAKIAAVGSNLTQVQQTLLDKIAANEAAGMSRDQAIQKAVDTVASNLGTTRTDLLTKIGATETTLTTKIADLAANTKTAIADVQKTLLDKIAANEAAGLSRDQAIQKAVDTVASNLGTTRSDLLTKIGATETTLTSKINDLATQTQTQINAVQKAIQDQMAANEAAGMSRDDALNKAINDVSTQLNTTASQLATAIGTQYTGPTAQDVTAIQNIIASGSGGTGASDLKYDYNGDGKVDNADLSAIQGFMGGTGGVGGGTGTGAGTEFKPGAGSVWAQPTGIYKTIADEQAATQQKIAEEQAATQKKIADEAAATRAAQLAQSKALAQQAQQNQQMTNTSQLMNWLAQAGDTSGQQVTVNQSPLTEIKNVYDWKSIFATPQQEKMFVTPYKEGGTVDDLMKILKG